MFWALASAIFCGDKVKRQLKAKNITTATISMLAPEMILEQRFSVKSRPKLMLILFPFGNDERGDNRREVEGEDHDGDPQPDGDQNTVVTKHGYLAQVDLIKDGTVPVRNEGERNNDQTGNKGKDQIAHYANHQILAEIDHEGHQQQQPKGDNTPIERRHLQLMFPECHEGIGDCHTIYPQQWADGKEIEEGNYHPAHFAKMLFNGLGNICRWVTAGKT